MKTLEQIEWEKYRDANPPKGQAQFYYKDNCEYWIEGFKTSTAIHQEITKKLVDALDHSLRQWHMYMTDMQRDDLEELLKDSNNIEAHLFKHYQDVFKEFKDLK